MSLYCLFLPATNKIPLTRTSSFVVYCLGRLSHNTLYNEGSIATSHDPTLRAVCLFLAYEEFRFFLLSDSRATSEQAADPLEPREARPRRAEKEYCLQVSFPCLHNVYSVQRAEDFRNKNQLLVLRHDQRKGEGGGEGGGGGTLIAVWDHVSFLLRPASIWSLRSRAWRIKWANRGQVRSTRGWGGDWATRVHSQPRQVLSQFYPEFNNRMKVRESRGLWTV